jgi:hypothetical protein
MGDGDHLLSALVDQAIASQKVPWPCPSDFGPNDRYRLEALVAVGSGGLVYRATDRLLSSEGFQAQVALKIIPDAIFRSEALTTRRVNHPFVLSIIDRGDLEDGGSYVASEYVEGGDLSAANVPFAPRKAAELVARLASAVQAAHSAGVVHCDLKPANVLLTLDGRPKLSDFGLARWEIDEQGSSRGNTAFMSPEQFARSEDALTPPSDIYALGGILYWLLTGHMPHGNSPEDVDDFHRRGRPIPSPGIDRDLDAICRRATSLTRVDRYQSAGQLQEDLERWLAREPIPWTRPSPVRRFKLLAARRPWSVLAVSIVLLIVLAALGTWRYNLWLDEQRRAHMQREAVRIAQEEVEATKKRAQKLIEQWASFAFSTGEPEHLLSALPWLEWLGAAPVLTHDGKMPSVEERSLLLRAHIRASSQAGEGRLDTLLSKYALAHVLIGTGDLDEAATLLEDVKAGLVPRLADNDPLRLSVDALGLCVAYLRASEEERPGAALALESADTALAAVKGTMATRQLIARVRFSR